MVSNMKQLDTEKKKDKLVLDERLSRQCKTPSLWDDVFHFFTILAIIIGIVVIFSDWLWMPITIYTPGNMYE